MFAVRFDPKSLIAACVAWKRVGSPTAAVPIYVRNFVRARVDHNGQLTVDARHQEFVLVDGVESLVGDAKEGWESEYALCVNRARWPAEPMAEGLATLCAVDQEFPQKAAAAMAASTEARSLRIDRATCRAFAAWCEVEVRSSNERLSPDSRTEYYRSASHGVVTKVSLGWITARVPCRLEPLEEKGLDKGWCAFRVYSPRLVSTGGVVEVREQQQRLSLKIDQVPVIDETVYHGFVERLKAEVEAAKVVAAADDGLPVFPAVTPIENGYPPAELPTEVEVSMVGFGERGWYNLTCDMLDALGYVAVSEHRSGNNKTRSSKWRLKANSSIRDLVPEATRFDEKRAIIFVPARLMGRVIGARGLRINEIRHATGRNWSVKPDNI